MDYKTLIEDMRTYQIMTQNENFHERLLEAYNAIKKAGIETYEQFRADTTVPIGAFTYGQVTIFDRLKDKEYEKILDNAWFDLHNCTQQYIEDPVIGDKLASWGKLGNTPYREDLISKGYIMEGLTEEEAAKHFGR